MNVRVCLCKQTAKRVLGSLWWRIHFGVRVISSTMAFSCLFFGGDFLNQCYEILCGCAMSEIIVVFRI